MGTVSPWTDAHNEALKTLVASGIAYSAIAIELNAQCGTDYTRNSCIGKAKRLGLIAPDRVRAPRIPPKPSHQEKRIRLVVSNRVYDMFENAAQVQLRCVEIVPMNVTLLERADNGCTYIPGDDHLYCGHPSKAGTNMCAPHFFLCLLPPI